MTTSIRIFKNISGQTLTIPDFMGKVVDVDEEFDGYSFGPQVLLSSSDLAMFLLEKKLELYDGFQRITGMEALNIVKGTSTQLTRDGKTIITASDRPKDTFRHFTGKGDDIAGQIVGAGNDLEFSVGPASSQVVDVQFLQDVFVKDGTILYENAELGSYLTVEVICAPGVPFPSPTQTGTFDLVNGALVPNTEGTGTFMTAPVEVKLNRFINHMHLLGSGKDSIMSPESFMLSFLYFLRFTIYNASATSTLTAAITMGMYRVKTL